MTTADTSTFSATATGGRKHLPQCPYVVGSLTCAVPADDDRPVCDWCARELSGHGRRQFTDLGLALEAFRAPLENRGLIRHELRGVEHDDIWLPYSGSYLALGLRGRAVAWTGKTYVVPRPGLSIPLHGYSGVARQGRTRSEQRLGATCPSCWQARSVSGVCACD